MFVCVCLCVCLRVFVCVCECLLVSPGLFGRLYELSFLPSSLLPFLSSLLPSLLGCFRMYANMYVQHSAHVLKLTSFVKLIAVYVPYITYGLYQMLPNIYYLLTLIDEDKFLERMEYIRPRFDTALIAYLQVSV